MQQGQFRQDLVQLLLLRLVDTLLKLKEMLQPLQELLAV